MAVIMGYSIAVYVHTNIYIYIVVTGNVEEGEGGGQWAELST